MYRKFHIFWLSSLGDMNFQSQSVQKGGYHQKLQCTVVRSSKNNKKMKFPHVDHRICHGKKHYNLSSIWLVCVAGCPASPVCSGTSTTSSAQLVDPQNLPRLTTSLPVVAMSQSASWSTAGYCWPPGCAPRPNPRRTAPSTGRGWAAWPGKDPCPPPRVYGPCTQALGMEPTASITNILQCTVLYYLYCNYPPYPPFIGEIFCRMMYNIILHSQEWCIT